MLKKIHIYILQNTGERKLCFVYEAPFDLKVRVQRPLLERSIHLNLKPQYAV